MIHFDSKAMLTKQYRLQLPYEGCRTCLTYHMAPYQLLVINNLGVDTHRHTQTHTHVDRHTDTHSHT